MSDTPNIDELRAKLAALDKLLADPHPGLFAWLMLYDRRVRELLALWNLELPGVVSKKDSPNITTAQP